MVIIGASTERQGGLTKSCGRADRCTESRSNHHNGIWPGNVTEISTRLWIHDCLLLELFRGTMQGFLNFPFVLTHRLETRDSVSLTNSSDNSENFESSLVVWKNQRLHELASIWHSGNFWKMIAVLPTFSPAIRHLETLWIPSPSPFPSICSFKTRLGGLTFPPSSDIAV